MSSPLPSCCAREWASPNCIPQLGREWPSWCLRRGWKGKKAILKASGYYLCAHLRRICPFCTLDWGMQSAFPPSIHSCPHIFIYSPSSHPIACTGRVFSTSGVGGKRADRSTNREKEDTQDYVLTVCGWVCIGSRERNREKLPVMQHNFVVVV